MSYILDALRRADAERQQGQLPGLHARVETRALPTPAPNRGPLWWAGAATLLAMIAAAAGWWLRPAPRAPPAPVSVQLAPAAAVPATPLPAEPPAAPPVVLPIVVSAPPAPPPAPAAAVAPAVAAPAASKPQTLSQLGADLRRQLPPLVVGGSVWSDSAASRFIMLDGLMLREGDTVAPGLVLERIQPRAALLRWRERLLELPL